ncbi:MAG: C10 family peptidase [Bacteroidia bacterium]|nr:C10 family peptidase [Bacteroidia bacterium]
MKRNLLFLILLFPVLLHAAQVTIDLAKKVGKNYYYERANITSTIKYEDIYLDWINSDNSADLPFYIFNINEDKGFIIVSADDATVPVLGYGFEGSFNKDNIAPSLNYLLNDYARQIRLIRTMNIQPAENVVAVWKEYSQYLSGKGSKTYQNVGPLFLTNWDQSYPYNALCPADAGAPSGYNGIVPVGCVAVSMAQAMKYYNYPLHGVGSNTDHTDYGNFTVNFAAQTYNWSNMPYTLSTGSDYQEVAKFLYHSGIAVNMNYGPDGSSASEQGIQHALVNNFKYNSSCTILDRMDYSDPDWIAALKGELNNARPTCYVGYGDAGGHAWNCDGYQGETGSEMFHMNWGWGGQGNGYFNINNLVVLGTPFLYGHCVVVNIFPASGYPEFCTGQKVFTTQEANFDDGSGNQDYHNNINCKYLIQSTCGNKILLHFDKFDLQPEDAVYIFDGTTTSDSLIAVLYGGATVMDYSSTSANMLLNFVTNGASTKPGWTVHYKIEYCIYNGITYHQLSGTISDGSGACNYKNSTNCKWYIDIPDASDITLNFTSFNLASDGDFLGVYKNSLITENLIQKYTYQNIPSAPLSINAPLVILRFFTNSATNAQGWSLIYNSVLSGVHNYPENISDIFIYPNPITDETQVCFDLAANSNVSLSVTDLLGQELFLKQTFSPAGHYIYNLRSLIPHLSNGVYILNVKTDKNSVVKKIFCGQ